MQNKLVILLGCVLLAGCATPYQPYSYIGGGGYKDVQLADNVFRVTVEWWADIQFSFSHSIDDHHRIQGKISIARYDLRCRNGI